MKTISYQQCKSIRGGLSDSNRKLLGRLRYFKSTLGPSMIGAGGALQALAGTKSRPKAADKQR